jgi:hypothetical protein
MDGPDGTTTIGVEFNKDWVSEEVDLLALAEVVDSIGEKTLI